MKATSKDIEFFLLFLLGLGLICYGSFNASTVVVGHFGALQFVGYFFAWMIGMSANGTILRMKRYAEWEYDFNDIESEPSIPIDNVRRLLFMFCLCATFVSGLLSSISVASNVDSGLYILFFLLTLFVLMSKNDKTFVEFFDRKMIVLKMALWRNW